MEALNICLQSSIIVYKDIIYKQIFGCPTCPFLFPIIANIVMEKIEQTTLTTYLISPSLWVCHVNDVYAIMKKTGNEFFRDYLNTAYPSIKVTKELEKSRQLALLDLNIGCLKDG